MSWSWSHTAEAYENADINVHGLALETLITIWAEWKAYRPEEEGLSSALSDFDSTEYRRARDEAKSLVATVGKNGGAIALADDIWEWMSELATCTNGGFQAWCCPFGCGCHMVPFDKNLGLFRSASRRQYDHPALV